MKMDCAKRAIVVDDSSAVRAILRFILIQYGFEVTEAKDGNDGLRVLRSHPVQLALIDWNMPEMSGFDMLGIVRADSAFDSMKVMMVTTETDLKNIEKALARGANEYAMKPFNRDIIWEKLRLMGF